MRCKIKIKQHATDRCIERGISDQELHDCINKGARITNIILAPLLMHFRSRIT